MEKMTFEQSMQRLDEIVKILEKNEVGLEESLKLFEEGLNLSKQLNVDLSVYENKIAELTKSEDNN